MPRCCDRFRLDPDLPCPLCGQGGIEEAEREQAQADRMAGQSFFRPGLVTAVVAGVVIVLLAFLCA